jgi:hypothetical protein
MTLKFACCLALALGASAMAAQQTSTPATEDRGDLDAIRRVSTLIGTRVMNRSNSQVADLRDLVLSPSGDVLFALLGTGGVAGVGENYTAIPFDALEIRPADGKWTALLDMTADEIKKAPLIRSDNYRELTDPQWVAITEQFFRTRNGARVRPDGTTAAPREPQAVPRVFLATKIRHSELKNPQKEDLGKIEELLLNRDYRVAFLIVGRGGVVGIGEHYLAVPWSRIGLNANPQTAAVTVSLEANKAQMERAPEVKGDNYATMLAHGFADEVRHYFATLGRAPVSR